MSQRICAAMACLLLFGCQSQPIEQAHFEPQDTRLTVVQVGDMTALAEAAKTVEAQSVTVYEAAGHTAQEGREAVASSATMAELAPYLIAADRGFSVRQEGERCTVWVRAGAKYQDNLGRGVAACLKAQRP